MIEKAEKNSVILNSTENNEQKDIRSEGDLDDLF